MGVSAQPLINKTRQIIAIASVVGEFFIWSSLKCIQKFNERIERWKLGDRVQAVEGDILDESVYEDLLKKATVIYLYLLPEGLQEAVTLMNKLEERMRDGSRIVMNTWTPKSWTRDKEKTWKDNNTSLYLFDKSSLIKEKTEL